MALCFVPSHAVPRLHNGMSIKYGLSHLPTYCHPNFSTSSEISSSLQVIHCVLIMCAICARVWRLSLHLIISRCDNAKENQGQQQSDDSRGEEKQKEKEQSQEGKKEGKWHFGT